MKARHLRQAKTHRGSSMKQKTRDRIKAVRSNHKNNSKFWVLLKQQFILEKSMVLDTQAVFNNIDFTCFTIKQASALFSAKAVKFSPADNNGGIKTKDGYGVEFALDNDSAMHDSLDWLELYLAVNK